MTNDNFEIMESIPYEDFIFGEKNKSLKLHLSPFFKNRFKILTVSQKATFYFFVILYMLGPIIIVPYFAHKFDNRYLLFGILISYISTLLTPRTAMHIFFITLFCIFFWIISGFDIHEYVTFFYFCALGGYFFYQMADGLEEEYAKQNIIKDYNLFYDLLLERKIFISRKKV